MVRPHSALGRRIHRTSIACRRCNSRKVKCTASAQVPCSGCELAGVECIPIDSQRGKYPRRKAQERIRRSSERPSEQGRTLEVVQPEHEAVLTTSRIAPASRPESPGAFYAQIAQQSLGKPETTPHHASETVFLGEAFSLSYVLHDVLAPFLADSLHFQRRQHFPLISNRTAPSRVDIVSKQVQYLKDHGLWFQPTENVLSSLLECYFDNFHPAFPIFQRSQFLTAVAQRQASLIVLNALLMVAVTICDDELLCGVEGPDRRSLRRLYYQQAKSLYDRDMEPEKFDIIAGVFLMSFWWDGPNDQKDSWHWLGVAASLAQSLGMHRSMQYSGVSQSKAKAWRRLWWSIRVRDTLVSGSIGRPQHFSDLSCDVELPVIDDVYEAIGEDNEEKITYSVEMAKLSVLFSQILTSRYAASNKGSESQTRETLEASLDRFREQIPSSLQYSGVDRNRRGLWSVTLLMALNYASILLCRPPRSMTGLEQTTQWGNTQKAIDSANEVTRAMEDILSVSIAHVCQIHTIPALFNALAMHIWALCTSSEVGRELAENRCRTCILGLSVMQESWPVGGWVYRLFVSIMKRLKARSGSSTRDDGLVRHFTHVPSSRGPYQTPESWQTEGNAPSLDNCSANPAYSLLDSGDAQSFIRHNGQQTWWGTTEEVIAGDFIPDLFLLGDAGHNLPLDQGDFFDLLHGLH